VGEHKLKKGHSERSKPREDGPHIEKRGGWLETICLSRTPKSQTGRKKGTGGEKNKGPWGGQGKTGSSQGG